MSETAVSSPRPHQSQELIYALDIGTRSVIGILGTKEAGKIRVLAMEKLLHTHRVMMDGQIEDIAQVAAAVRAVTDRLEQDMGCKLERASVAAAGRALRTEQGHALRELSAPEPVTAPLIAQLEAAAVAEAEQTIRASEGDAQQLLLVGYTAIQYQLDGYPLATLLGHTGRRLETQVVATFLPSGVIDSLYAVMRQAGLEVASLTLEPIAALNAAIPADLRLLNLCLVDIGAGTSDIAVCRDGSVVGYTMATVAGDEITEALMKEYLVDYTTAEQMKSQLSQSDTLTFTDILGQKQSCTNQQAQATLEPAAQLLAKEISQRVLDINGSAPSALFLAGGGSKLDGLGEKIAAALDMDPKRVAVAGGHFKTSAFSDILTLEDPEYTTPLGIAVSAGLGLISDSCQVTLNGTRAKLFRSGDLSAMDLLMMNGYTYFDLLGRSGKPLVLQVDGRRTVFHGEPALPARLQINGSEAQPSALVHAGDRVDFIPAVAGQDCRLTAAQLAQRLGARSLTVNGVSPQPDELVPSGAFVVVSKGEAPPAAQPEAPPPVQEQTEPADPVPARQEETPAPVQPPVEPARPVPTQATAAPVPPVQVQPAAKPEAPISAPAAPACTVFLNGQPVSLPPKTDGAPHYVMDLLERSGIDFKHAQRPVAIRVNGADCLFQQVLQAGDQISIGYEDEVNPL